MHLKNLLCCPPCCASAAAGFGVGGRSGYYLAKLPPVGPHEPERWSAPLWLKVRVAELGLCFG